LVGLFAMLFDIILEPAAISLGYWYWDGGSPPLTNYITWFGAGIFFAFLIPPSNNAKESPNDVILIHIYTAQLLYFVLIIWLYM